MSPMDQTDFLSIEARIGIYTRVLPALAFAHERDCGYKKVDDCECEQAEDCRALAAELLALIKQRAERRKLLALSSKQGNMTSEQAAEFLDRWDGTG